MRKKINESIGISSGGIDASKIYSENVIFQAERGHGFAAEKANHVLDKLSGKNAKLVGGDNVKNGADRIVNGISIQTKYCSTGSKCVSECFDSSGFFRYFNTDGTPMLIEVPSDKYDDAVKALSDKITKGCVNGISDPSKATEIIKKGGFTYEQARKIAMAGTVEGLTYDAIRGIELAGGAACISAAITFSLALWNGDDLEEALTSACYAGIKVGGITWVSSILSSQIARTGVEQSLRGTTDWIVKQFGPTLASHIAAGAGKAIYGSSAINYVSKLLRGNVVTAVITTLILSSSDLYRMFDGRISKAQLIKNISTVGAGVAGGYGGWQAGAAIGATVGSALPVVGTALGATVGSVIGSIAGSSTAHGMAKKALGKFIEDDADRMLRILENAFTRQAQQYLLNKTESEILIKKIESMDLMIKLQDMFAAPNREIYAVKLLRPHIKSILKKRTKINTPSNEVIIDGISLAINRMDAIDLTSNDEDVIEVEQNTPSDFYSFIDLAEEGDADAQFNLGNFYYYGVSVEENDKEAMVWYLKAAKQGHADAQFNLGDMYFLGQGIEEDDEKAKKWYRKAAKQGHHGAQISLKRIENPFWILQESIALLNRGKK